MSEKIHTREFCISDYDAALQLWHRVEGLEIAEGDEREDIAQFFARNPGLSRVAVGIGNCWSRIMRERWPPRTHLPFSG